MGRILPLVLSMFLLTSGSLIYNASAQTVLPDIDIDCIPESRVDVYPGSTFSGFFTCTLSNPTTYNEEVEVTITSGSLLSTGPGTVTVGPSATLDIQIFLRAEQGMAVQSIAVETKAMVVSANDIDTASLPEASDTAETIAYIMEYSAPTIQLTEGEISIVSGEEYDYNVIYGNNGNGIYDRMLIGISSYTRDELETAGFSIYGTVDKIEIESGSTAKVNWQIFAPEGIKNDQYYLIEFYVMSEFSCRYEYGCNTQSMMLTVLVTGEETEDSLGDSALLYSAIGGGVLAAAVAIVIFMKRRNSATFEQDDYEEDFEEDIDDDFEEDWDDDFEDDLDDDFFDDL